MSRRDDATEAQVRAAEPATSTWLAANAGSGKTRVLTDRVARLLLDGVEPQHILCLTYTKAAASEMQNRLFRRLGDWAMLEAGKLHTALRALGVEGEIDATRLRNARRLFARALETPGGLKIQTIHSFCSALLRRFPLEAGVSPQFSEIEDRAADLLRADVLDAMSEDMDRDCVSALAAHFDGDDLAGLTAEIVGHAEQFKTAPSKADIWALFDLPDGFTEADLERMVFSGGEDDLIEAFAPVMRLQGVTDQKHEGTLTRALPLTLASLPVLESVFLFGPSAKNPSAAKTGAVPSKATQKQMQDRMPDWDAFMERVEAARPMRLGLAAAERSHVLHRFAVRFVDRYMRRKAQRGWLDFDDLIARARQLLTDPAVAAWVLYRIDGGIDHILVDEGQDTSPAQWDVIRKLAAEFSSGQGARDDRQRTIFVVGDKKQSIYSFQGADPRAFDEMEAEFEDKLQSAAEPFQRTSLQYSFRSSQAILRLVDEVFDDAEPSGFAPGMQHLPFKHDLPGRVDLWPVIPRQETAEDTPWYNPLDRASDEHHTSLLADRIAGQIKAMLEPDSGVTVPIDTKDPQRFARRRVKPGDFLILFQSRKMSSQNSLFAAVIRSLKAEGLPVAGADRLRVGAELAVRDLCALLSFLAMPEDSLSLASALKSPLFGWTEQDLYRIAQGRGKQHLWQVLRNLDCPTTTVLKDLRAQVDFLRPYDLLERILTRHRGRRHILARLGTEAEDGINALLAQAMAYERTAVPSLTGFLVWMETDDLVIKRQVDSASDQIRVMTVHGAKGLEAPIVILPDCGPQQARPGDQIVTVNDTPVWKSRAADTPDAVAIALAEQKQRADQERDRLLYVALTRAEKWLIVAAAGDLKDGGDSWYQKIETAFDRLPAVGVTERELEFQRYAHAEWDALPLTDDRSPAQPEADLPDYLQRAAPPPPAIRKVLSPSDLGGAKALAGADGWDEDRAKRYGTQVHQLLETLSVTPRDQRDQVIARLRPREDPDFSLAVTEACALLDSTAHRHLFAPVILSEVTVTADLGQARIHGIIDTLVVTETQVQIVDFKTNRVVPARAADCPEAILRQMGAYSHALAQIYPGREITCGVLWTRTGHFMELSHDLVTDALRRTGYLDVTQPDP